MSHLSASRGSRCGLGFIAITVAGLLALCVACGNAGNATAPKGSVTTSGAASSEAAAIVAYAVALEPDVEAARQEFTNVAHTPLTFANYASAFDAVLNAFQDLQAELRALSPPPRLATAAATLTAATSGVIRSIEEGQAAVASGSEALLGPSNDALESNAQPFAQSVSTIFQAAAIALPATTTPASGPVTASPPAVTSSAASSDAAQVLDDACSTYNSFDYGTGTAAGAQAALGRIDEARSLDPILVQELKDWAQDPSFSSNAENADIENRCMKY